MGIGQSLADGKKIKTDDIAVSIDTCCHTIVGTVHPPSMAYRSRLSDLLNQKDVLFLSVTGALVYEKGKMEAPLYSAEFLAVNTRKIEMIREK